MGITAELFFFSAANKNFKVSSNCRIDKIMDIAHPNLIRYLHERGLSEKVYPFIKELWFTTENKQLYAIGFKNNSDGWELKNAFYKGVLLKKDISLFSFFEKVESISKNETGKNIPYQKVAVFEGFTDALSFIEMQKSFQEDLLTLNSTLILKKTLALLDSYSEITLFLDNNPAGRACTSEIIKIFPNAIDFSHLYSDYKDLNQ
ncbi:toprim domain-containing protein [Chryseobacterium camelliae]|uniref:Toprim domain-containing protein n=1 Tax=Chryseobacterium camelliae TaxID=1265445 RepID=A0ABY7QLU6_9FLAO|nr:toprim domain-containing protein [Chryseobacterium camelliae]WBV60645.1 toprim domain-containing protein [Chryseobacterium camelliae]